MALAVVVVLGPFRQEPLWVRPENSVSPRQRRRRGFGLLLLVVGYTVNWLNSVAEANLGLATWVLIGLGGWLVAVGDIWPGPTEAERERRAQLLDREGG